MHPLWTQFHETWESGQMVFLHVWSPFTNCWHPTKQVSFFGKPCWPLSSFKLTILFCTKTISLQVTCSHEFILQFLKKNSNCGWRKRKHHGRIKIMIFAAILVACVAWLSGEGEGRGNWSDPSPPSRSLQFPLPSPPLPLRAKLRRLPSCQNSYLSIPSS